MNITESLKTKHFDGLQDFREPLKDEEEVFPCIGLLTIEKHYIKDKLKNLKDITYEIGTGSIVKMAVP